MGAPQIISAKQYQKIISGPSGKAHKYGARKSHAPDGEVFPSVIERNYYVYLQMQQRAGEIEWFEKQVSFTFVVDSVSVCRYIADFVVMTNGEFEVRDTKGVETETFKIKKKLFKAIYGVDIVVIGRSQFKV